MKILLIGSFGQLGWELQRSLLPLGQIVSVDFPEIDLTKPDSIINWVRGTTPDVIINAAAYTAVDQAEDEVEIAHKINTIAPGILAEEALSQNAVLIHFSTDYVFNGNIRRPYLETDLAAPINEYGRSKLGGENVVQQIGGEYFIYRTSWLYSTRRDCFLTKVLRWGRTHKVIKIVTDQIGSPTWCRVLADTTAQSINKMNTLGKSWRQEKSGIYHIAGNGFASRYDWAKRILELDPLQEEQIITQVQEAKSDDFETKAERPRFSALDCTHFQNTFEIFYTEWADALEKALSYNS